MKLGDICDNEIDNVHAGFIIYKSSAFYFLGVYPDGTDFNISTFLEVEYQF